MIWSWIPQIFFSVVDYLMSFIDPVVDTSGFAASLATGSQYLSVPYQFIPSIIATILIIVAFDLLFEGGYLFFKVIYWVLRRFPTQS